MENTTYIYGKTFDELVLDSLAYRIDNEIGVTTLYDENGEIEQKIYPTDYEYNCRLLNRRGVEIAEQD